MKRPSSRNIKFITAVFGLLLLLISIIMISTDHDTETTVSLIPEPDSTPKGFTFLNLHANSILTSSVRDRLREALGSEAVETKTVLDLEMHYPGFLATYFPSLNNLNRKLNFEDGFRMRVEHNTIGLIYRHSSSFKHVELFFSNYTQKPLLFRIKAKRESSDILSAVRKRYGEPEVITWKDNKGRSLIWKQDKDVLIISLFADQYGNPQFEIMICHVGNIEKLLLTEHAEKRKIKAEKEKAGKTVF